MYTVYVRTHHGNRHKWLKNVKMINCPLYKTKVHMHLPLSISLFLKRLIKDAF